VFVAMEYVQGECLYDVVARGAMGEEKARGFYQ